MIARIQSVSQPLSVILARRIMPPMSARNETTRDSDFFRRTSYRSCRAVLLEDPIWLSMIATPARTSSTDSGRTPLSYRIFSSSAMNWNPLAPQRPTAPCLFILCKPTPNLCDNSIQLLSIFFRNTGRGGDDRAMWRTPDHADRESWAMGRTGMTLVSLFIILPLFDGLRRLLRPSSPSSVPSSLLRRPFD